MKIEYFTLDQLGFVGRGKSKHRPRNDESLYGGDYPFIQTGDVKKADLYVREFSQTYNEKGLAQSKLWPKDTLCITIAANIADTAILSMDACFPDSIIGFIADPNKVNVKYIKYFYSYFQRNLQNVSQGAAQDNLNLEKLLRYPIPCPPLKTQNLIVEILGSIDDLIVVNSDKVSKLESLLEKIYQDWFVKLKSPNYQNVGMVEGIPDGWQELPLIDLFELQRGFDLPNSERKHGKYPIYASTGIVGYHNEMKVSYKTVVTGRSGTLGQVRLTTGESWPLNTTLWGKCFKKVSPELAYFILKNIDLTIFNSGAAVPTLNRNDLYKLKILTPPQFLVERFTLIASPIFEKINVTVRKNHLLSDLKFSLLPHLISGELDVSKLSCIE